MAERPSGTAVGFTIFAGVMMIWIGFMHALWGISAIAGDAHFVTPSDYVYDVGLSGWGWIHLIAGIIIFLAGFGVFRGALWARTVGVTLAVISGIAAFTTILYFPIWSLVIIALDIAVIWALSARGRDITQV